MKATTTRRSVVLVAAGALGLGGIAAAGPALAGTDIFAATRSAVVQQGPGNPERAVLVECVPDHLCHLVGAVVPDHGFR